MQIFSSNARGDSDPLVVNYVTPIDVAEGRLSSDSAYNPTNGSSKSSMFILAIVLGGFIVFGMLLAGLVLLLIKRRRENQINRDSRLEENHLRSTTLVSVDDCQGSNSPEFEVTHSDHNCPQSQTFFPISEFGSSASSPQPRDDPKTKSTMNIQLPTITCAGSLVSNKFSNTRGTTQRERIVRAVPQEPPDPDILLYRLKSSGE